MWCTVGITRKSNGGHGDDWTFGKPLLQFVILRLAFGQPEAEAVIVDHDADVIRVFARGSGSIEGRIVQIPFGRSDSPDELRKIMPLFVVACAATFRGSIILMPPLELGFRRQRALLHLKHGLSYKSAIPSVRNF